MADSSKKIADSAESERGIGHFKMATVDHLSGISKTYVLKFKGDLKTTLVPFWFEISKPVS